MKKIFVSIFLASCLMYLTACSSSDYYNNEFSDSKQNVLNAELFDEDVLKVVQPMDPGTFEPGNNDEQSYERIMLQIYDTLIRFDADGKLQPWLAESGNGMMTLIYE